MMTRREFVTTTTAAAAALALPASGCTRASRAVRPGLEPASSLEPALERILSLAALAPSSHNVQPWVAVGVEYWWSRIGLKSGDARASWSSPVATVGAGWVFPVWRGLYLNPWAAAHAPLDAGAVAVGTERYRPRALEAEVSLKAGWGHLLGR